MSKLLAALCAVSFAFATTGALAAEPAKDAPKVDCKDVKNKDHADCKAPAKK